MKKLLFLVLFLPTHLTHATSDENLIKQTDKLNSQCRGGSGDNPATIKACDKRDKLIDALALKGWCYGHVGQAGYERQWERCSVPQSAQQQPNDTSPLAGRANDEAVYVSPDDNARPGQTVPIEYMRQVIYTQRKCELPIKDADIMRAYVFSPLPKFKSEGCAGRLLNMDFKVIYKNETTLEGGGSLISYQEDIMPSAMFYKGRLSKSGSVTIGKDMP